MIFARILPISLIFFASFCPSAAFATVAKIEKVAAGSVVTVARAGKVVKLKEGDALESGDELTTDGRTAVDLRLEDETLIRVGVNSSYRVQEDSKLHMLVHRLLAGVVRVLVKPTDHDKKDAALKFRMSTPEGTIGVRGTEFVVLSGGGKTEVKGLDGEVVFGPVNADLTKAGDFVTIGRGFHSSIGAGAKSAGRPEKFDLKSYIDQISEKQGVFGPLAGRVSGGNKYMRDGSKAGVAFKPQAVAVAPISSAEPQEAKGKKKEGQKTDYQMLLFQAAEKGNIELAKKALKNGALINGRGEIGHTPLQVAMLFKQTEMFVFLISKGANVEAEDENHHTPLMFVALNNLDLEYAKVLVRPGGADFHEKDASGKSVIQMAKENNAEELAAYLSSQEAEDDLAKAQADKAKHKDE